jgi:hypothetical protein
LLHFQVSGYVIQSWYRWNNFLVMIH